jgi:hypothetical protein
MFVSCGVMGGDGWGGRRFFVHYFLNSFYFIPCSFYFIRYVYHVCLWHFQVPACYFVHISCQCCIAIFGCRTAGPCVDTDCSMMR